MLGNEVRRFVKGLRPVKVGSLDEFISAAKEHDVDRVEIRQTSDTQFRSRSMPDGVYALRVHNLVYNAVASNGSRIKYVESVMCEKMKASIPFADRNARDVAKATTYAIDKVREELPGVPVETYFSGNLTESLAVMRNMKYSHR